MRKKIILTLLSLLLVGWGVMIGLQKRAAHEAPAVAAPSPASSSSASASASSSASPPGSGSGSALAPPGSGSAVAPPPGSGGPDAGAPKLMDRPLRVTALGWDLAAPGLLANGGADPAPASDFAAEFWLTTNWSGVK